VVVPVDGMGTCICGGCEGAPGPGLQKLPCRVGKWFRDHLVVVPERKEETSGSENETRLVAARPPGPEPGSLPGSASAAVQALRRLTTMTSSRDPTRMVMERGPWRRMA
jgi:hypothetical protein